MRRTISRLFPCLLTVALLAAACGKPSSEPAPAQPLPSTWTVLGPGGGGAQYLPTINPQDPQNVYIRCDMTAAYSTRDGGKSWHMYNLRSVVRAFEIDPSQPNVAYAANSGLYRTEDKGLTWSLVYPAPANIVAERMLDDHAEQSFETADGLPGGEIVKVRVDPSDSGHLILGVAPEFRRGAGMEGEAPKARLITSHDRGASWTVAAEIEGRNVLAIVPGAWDSKPGELIVITDRKVARIAEDGGKVELSDLPVGRPVAADCGKDDKGSVIYLLTDIEEQGGKPAGGVFVSRDRGRTWKLANDWLTKGWKVGNRLPSLTTLAVCQSNPSTVYLSCAQWYDSPNGTPRRNFGILKTVDSGAAWEWVYRCTNDSILSGNGPGGWMETNYGPEWGEYPLSLGVCPSNADICYASDFGCTYNTTDGGKTWTQVYADMQPDGASANRGINVTTCYGMHFDPFDPQHLFISYTDIGAFQSFDGGKSWLQAINGTPRPWINTCYWMTFDPKVQGRAWSVWGSGHDLPRPKMFRGGYFDRYVGGVALSSDACRSWQQSNSGMPDNTVCTHILLDPESPVDARVLYVCGFGKGVFKSVDGGASWSLMNNGLGANLNAWRITRLPDGALYLLVSRGLENRQVVDGGLYVSRDGAQSWQSVPLPQGYNAPNDLVFDPSDPQRMYLSCWPWTDSTSTERCGGLLRTSDGGSTWEQAFVEDAHVYAAAVDPDNTSTVIINTFDSAAFRSDNRGDTWSRLPGYSFKWGHRPVFDPHHKGMLYLTTFGGSVYYGPAVGTPGAPEDIVNFNNGWRWGQDAAKITSF